jgi:cob(I)alamin adenosyltransferase
MPIYTKTGDRGQTSLMGGKRLSKANLRVESYGTVDELNSVIGVVIAHLPVKNTPLEEALEAIQHDLLEVGANLANPEALPLPFLLDRATDFEKMIDEFTAALPELTHFILPGGGVIGASLHHARTICRRLERTLVRLSDKEQVDQAIIMYVNRLSDLFFTMARFTNHMTGEKETIWISRQKMPQSARPVKEKKVQNSDRNG